VCSNYRGITLLSHPGKVYSRVLERRLQPIVERQLQEEQCGSWPWNNGPALYPCRVVAGGMGVCPSSLHALCGLGEGLRPCPLGNPVGGTAGIWATGAVGTCHSVLVQPKWELCPYYRHKVKHVLSGCWTLPRLSLVIDFVYDLHGQNLKAQPR